ncbi:pilus assembly protein [Desulfurivibrio sp. D14AmB]|uniref:pilus assembly protein n=1 Tax=Desulfurivibrio sp. D14AmB TaxID=3374370 RepID=UPI00376ECBED
MISRQRTIKTACAIFILTLFGLLPSLAAAGYCDSTNPDKVPPFLTPGVDPNMLLIIDNSASMYDLAYIEDASLCYDDSYDPAASYAGYFEEEDWYAYEGGKFVGKSDLEATTICGTATHRKTTVTGANHICLKETGGVFDALVTKGKFLNWAAVSKLDIEKQILTGGKYVSIDSTLQMESRGCLERRFVRKTSFTTGGFLTLAVRPPTPTEQMDAAGTATRIEIFPVTSDGYDHEACQLAIDEMRSDDPKLGTIKGYIDECMGYTPGGGGDDPERAARSTFNHSVQDCWYITKQGLDQWLQTSTGSINRIKNDCESIYEKTPMSPWEITTDHSGYLCFGDYREPPTALLSVRGYVGRCWSTGDSEETPLVCVYRQCTDEPVSGANPRCSNNDGVNDGYVYQCGGNYNVPQDSCNKEWERILDCTGGFDLGFVGWLGDQCVQQGLLDFCNLMNIPEVVDPSDQVTGPGDATDEFWNLPAMMVDAGVLEQMGEPLLVMAAKIAQSEVPSGLLQEFAADLRIGAMTFNRDGAKSECEQADPYVTYQCDDPGILDGGRVITPLGKGATHTDDLVDAINAIVADTWTPLAESMYNAIGYYLQDGSMRLAPGDFSTAEDPILAWCQRNNILLITDGAPTADQNPDVISFAESLSYNLGSGLCGALDGSTYLDDLARYGLYGLSADPLLVDPAYATPAEMADGAGPDKRRPINTYVVAAGKFRDEGTDKCNPNVLLEDTAQSGGTTLFRAENLNELEGALRAAFLSIRAGAAAGSAASVISATRSGEGAVYQAIFWPEKYDSADPSNKVTWVGEVQSLLVDAHGRLFEDTNGNRKLDPPCDNLGEPAGSCDRQITVFYDPGTETSRACYGIVKDGACIGPDGTPGMVEDIAEVSYLWSAKEWLESITDGAVTTNRPEAQYLNESATYPAKRYIFTWHDSAGDGIVHDSEVLAFEASTITGKGATVYQDLGVSSETEATEVINWIRGLDQSGLRRRLHDGKTWRLGDVVHSTPTVVSRPMEGFHMLYRDSTYAGFARQYNNRRHMVYFGGNDGMLHAVNGGFFNGDQNRFCLTPNCEEDEDDFALPLGAELWAYVPYNLWPHLKCLTEEEYGHKYYVDLVPRIFDVQIFDPTDPNYPEGWGTILVGGMRFGGEKVNLNGKTFASAYFVLDITNPEEPPRLLGEMTYTGSEAEMGFSTSVPTMVPMVVKGDNTNTTSEWYLVIGSGPTTLKGQSNQEGRVAVVDLKALVNDGIAFRIPTTPPLPDPAPQIGSFTLTGHDDSFVSDLVTVDFGLNYLANVVYFGTVSGDFDNWGGKVYRLVTDKKGVTGAQEPSLPHEWPGLLAGKGLDNPLPLIDVGQPVTAAPAISWDYRNYWVYFGTGRLYNRNDYNDYDLYTYYGIKEPWDCNDNDFSWATVENKDPGISVDPGQRGLLQVDQIRVLADQRADLAELQCLDGIDNCLPTGVTVFSELRDYIAGQGCAADDPADRGTDGWYRKFHRAGERNLGQATLLGGLLTYSAYLPSLDICAAEGSSDLYALYFQTGTAWHRPIFKRELVAGEEVEYQQRIGPGLAVSPSLHVGTDTGAKAFLQTSTGAIISLEQPELPFSDYRTGREWWREIYRNLLP